MFTFRDTSKEVRSGRSVLDLWYERRLHTLIYSILKLDLGVSELKQFCKDSNVLLSHCFTCLLHRIKATHAQSRLLSLLLCDVFFHRSKVFRDLTVKNLDEIILYIIGTKKHPLPSQHESSVYLQSTALECSARAIILDQFMRLPLFLMNFSG